MGQSTSATVEQAVGESLALYRRANGLDAERPDRELSLPPRLELTSEEERAVERTVSLFGCPPGMRPRSPHGRGRTEDRAEAGDEDAVGRTLRLFQAQSGAR